MVFYKSQCYWSYCFHFIFAIITISNLCTHNHMHFDLSSWEKHENPPTMSLFVKVTSFCTSTFLTLSKGKLKQTLEEVIKLCKEVYLFLRLWQVFCNGTNIVPQKFKRFESSWCWNPIPYMDSLMGPSRMEIVVLAWSFVYMTLIVSS